MCTPEGLATTEFMPDYDYEGVDVHGQSMEPTGATAAEMGMQMEIDVVDEYGVPAVEPTAATTVVDELGASVMEPRVATTDADKQGAPAVEPTEVTTGVDKHRAPGVKPTGATT